jgi:hypothetical protein
MMYRAYGRGFNLDPDNQEEECASLKGSIALAIAIFILRYSLSLGGIFNYS